MSNDRDFVTSRFGVDHAAQAGRRATDDRRRAPGALSRRSAVRHASSPDTARPLDHRSRARRWRNAISELTTLQGQYADWLEALPENLQDGATAEALQAICDLDLTELQAIVPPRGFGRD